MIVSVQSKEAFEKCKCQTVIQTFGAIEEFQRMYLRRQFDTAGIDSTAAAVIEVANSLGFSDLVCEMESQFLIETGREFQLTERIVNRTQNVYDIMPASSSSNQA